jgi:hypothetical protein
MRLYCRALAACAAVLLFAGAARADAPNYVYFFTANNNAFTAYLDMNNRTTDAQGYPVVNVKITAISDAFRGWIKTNLPGGETADYAIDPYSIDCAHRMVAEHRIVFYDANTFPLHNYDYGGVMGMPIAGSMKDLMMKKVCGF